MARQNPAARRRLRPSAAALAAVAALLPWASAHPAAGTAADDGLLFGALDPKEICPVTLARAGARGDPDQWSDADKNACGAEDPATIEAEMALVRDVFVRTANAYGAAVSAVETLTDFEALPDAQPPAAHRYLHDATAASIGEYAAAVDDLARLMQSSWWTVRAMPGSLAVVIDGQPIRLVEAPPDLSGRPRVALTAEGGEAPPAGWLPAADAAVALHAPVFPPLPPLAAPPAAPEGVPVQFYARLELDQWGGFIARTARELNKPELDALDYAVQSQVCQTLNFYCNKAAAPESAAAVAFSESLDGRTHAGFLASPPGYSICRVQIDWINKSVAAGTHFAARVVRTAERDGLAYEADLADEDGRPVRLGADLLLAFVRKELLAAADCWAPGTEAWNCTGPFCADIHAGARFAMVRRDPQPVVCARRVDGACRLVP
jgi:hypothetical protein